VRVIRLSCARAASANLTWLEHALNICTHINTKTPLRRQVEMVQVSCEEKTARAV